MTLVKPSTITSQSGSYNYKGMVSSPSQNYIDNQFPNILDKTNGDTITGTLTIAGLTTLTNGINILSPGSITFQTGTLCLLNSGSAILCDSGSLVQLNGTITIGSNITFLKTVSDPVISQDDPTAAGSGQLLSITAQNAHTSGIGGGVNINGGTAAGSSQGGNVQLSGGIGAGSGGDGLVILRQNSQLLLTLGNVGMQFGFQSVNLGSFSGAFHLSLSQSSCPWIQLTGTITGGSFLIFQPGLGPAAYIVTGNELSFLGTSTLAFTCNGNTATNLFSATGSQNAIVLIDSNDSISVIKAL